MSACFRASVRGVAPSDVLWWTSFFFLISFEKRSEKESFFGKVSVRDHPAAVTNWRGTKGIYIGSSLLSAMPGPTGEDTDDELDVIDSVPAHPPGPIGGAAAARPDAEDEDDGIDGDLLLGESSHAAARCCAASQEVTCERSARTVLQGRPQLALLAPRCADRAPRCGANGRRCRPCAPHLGRETVAGHLLRVRSLVEGPRRFGRMRSRAAGRPRKPFRRSRAPERSA